MTENTKPESTMENNNIDNNVAEIQKAKKPNLLVKILTFIPNLFVNAIGAVVGFFAGIRMGIKEINKENRAAKSFQTTKSDSEIFDSPENAQEQNNKDEITEIGKKLHEIAPDVEITRGDLSVIIQDVKSTGEPYFLGPDYGIPAMVYLEHGTIQVERPATFAKVKDFEREIEDVFKAWGENFSPDRRISMRQSMLKAIREGNTIDAIVHGTAIIVDGKNKRLIVEGKLPPEWKENPPEWLNAGPSVDEISPENIEVETETLDGNNPVNPSQPRYFVEAAKIAAEKEIISVGQLQRIFKIGYNEGTQLMTALQNEGIVVSNEDGKTYKAQITKEEFDKRFNQPNNKTEQNKENINTPVNEEKPIDDERC